jgi:hypothetical protein
MDYILGHQEEFVKPTDIKIALTLLGEGMSCPIALQLCDFLRAEALKSRPSAPTGLIFAEGQTHKKQVRLGSVCSRGEIFPNLCALLFFLHLRSDASW